MPGYVESGKGKCPYDPRQENVATLISESLSVSSWCFMAHADPQGSQTSVFIISSFLLLCFFPMTANCLPLLDGNLYAGVHVDFMGTDPAIFRTLGDRPAVRTEQYDSRWLNGECQADRMCSSADPKRLDQPLKHVLLSTPCCTSRTGFHPDPSDSRQLGEE